MKHPVTIIGMGMGPMDLTPAQLDVIQKADLIIGGVRHLAHFETLSAEKFAIHKNLKQVVQLIQDKSKVMKVVVLGSGDPLYYGIGSYLVKKIGPEHVRIMPNISSVASGFAKLKQSWNDACVVSLHGRKNGGALLDAINQYEKVAVFTDPERNPGWIADFLAKNKMTAVTMHVLENLGTPGERISTHDIGKPVTSVFKDPNMVILTQNPKNKKAAVCHPGLPESEFAHEDGLITKAEIRAVVLSKLRLFPDSVFWDLGAGSGSVSIEAGLFITRGRIVAVEQKKERIKQIQINKRRFGIHNMQIVHAKLPDGFETLPQPDRVFIGGGGRDLETIIRRAGHDLKPGGIMVVNTVLMNNIQCAEATMEKTGFDTQMIQIQVNRKKSMPYSSRMKAENPVWIITGVKP